MKFENGVTFLKETELENGNFYGTLNVFGISYTGEFKIGEHSGILTVVNAYNDKYDEYLKKEQRFKPEVKLVSRGTSQRGF